MAFVRYLEIPVRDMDRAAAFYEAVLGIRVERDEVDGYEMAHFPDAQGGAGAHVALARGDVYVPSKAGAIVYFDVGDIEAVIARAVSRGAAVLYPTKDIGAHGLVAEIEDSEGNRVALNQRR